MADNKYLKATGEIDFSEATVILPADALNLEKGTGNNSLQQTKSEKKFEFDNSNYDPSEKLPGVDIKFGAIGQDSVVLNGNSMAYGLLSTAEGRSTLAIGDRSHSEGTKTVAANNNAHAEGLQSVAEGEHSHAEGYLTHATGTAAHAEGHETKASQNQAHAEGLQTAAKGYQSHAEGARTVAHDCAHSEGADTVALGYATHAEGINTHAGEVTRHGWIEQAKSGTLEKTIETDGLIVVTGATVTQPYSIDFRVDNITKKIIAIVTPTPTNEDLVMIKVDYLINGQTPTPIPPQPEIDEHDNNVGNHAEGYRSETHLVGSHAEGHTSAAVGYASHAEGYDTLAFGQSSHAEGYMTEAYGNASHTAGRKTYAKADNQYVIGVYNDNKANTLFEVGNGDIINKKPSNAFEVYQDGHAEVQTQGITNKSVVIKNYLDQNYTTNLRTGAGAKSVVSYGGTPSATGNFALALGYSNNAAGEASAALGYRTKTTNRGQLSIGVNNKNANGALFDVGNGDVSGTASSAFTVYQDGLVVIPEGAKGIKIGNTILTEDILNQLLALLNNI